MVKYNLSRTLKDFLIILYIVVECDEFSAETNPNTNFINESSIGLLHVGISRVVSCDFESCDAINNRSEVTQSCILTKSNDVITGQWNPELSCEGNISI